MPVVSLSKLNPLSAGLNYLRTLARSPKPEVRSLVRAASRAHQAGVLPHHVTQGIGMDWTPESYGDYYARSVPIYAAIRIRAESLVQVPWKAHQLHPNGSRTDLPTNHPLQRLLDHPNPWMTGAELRRATETYLCLWGKAFWSIEPSEDNRSMELWPLRPDKLDVLPGPNNRYIRGYRYRGQAREVFYLPEEIEFFSYFNPMQDRTGLSPLAPLRLTADMGWDALRYNRNTFRNGGIPDFLMLTEDIITDQQVDEFYKRWEARFQGPDRSHRPAFATGIKEVRNLAFNQREMEFIEGLRWTVKDVSKVYGVPETMLAELQFATLANMQALERWFWRTTVIPEARLLQDRINTSLLPKLGFPAFEIDFDFSNIEALSEGQEARLKREGEYLDRGVMTINEVRRDRGMEDVPWGNEPRPRPVVSQSVPASQPSGQGNHAAALLGERQDAPSSQLRERLLLDGKHYR